MDRYRCTAINENCSDYKIADVHIVDQSQHCVHRYSCALVKYHNVPLDAVEIYPPENDELPYDAYGSNCKTAWMGRPSETDIARDLKSKKILEKMEHRKPIYIRCLDTTTGSTSTTKKHTGHPLPEPIVLASNNDDRSYYYLIGEVEEFLNDRHVESGNLGILKVTFPNTTRYTHVGFVGQFESSNYIKEEDIIGQTEYIRKSDVVVPNDLKLVIEKNKNNKNNSTNSILKQDVALHKIVLEEDMNRSRNSNSNGDSNGNGNANGNGNGNGSSGTMSSTGASSKGFLPNQFTGPVATTFVSSGSYLVIDSNANDPGCSPRVQVFDGKTHVCQKIISNETSDTMKSRSTMRKKYLSLTMGNNQDNETNGGNERISSSSSLARGCLLFRDESGNVLKGRRISNLVEVYGKIKNRSSKANLSTDKFQKKKIWVKGIAIGRPMPFCEKKESKKSITKKKKEQKDDEHSNLIDFENVPYNTLFELDIRNVHWKETSSERVVLKKQRPKNSTNQTKNMDLKKTVKKKKKKKKKKIKMKKVIYMVV